MEYDKEDVHIGEYGLPLVDCPLCGFSDIVDDEEYLTLTVDNIQFPVHFHHTCIENGATDIYDDEIKKYIANGISNLKFNKSYDWHTLCGNTFIWIHRWTGDETYEIVVTKDYYTVDIPFDKEEHGTNI